MGLLISNADGRIVYANGAVERLLGFELGTILAGGVTFGMLCPPAVTAVENVTNWLERQGPVGEPFEGVCLSASGQEIEVLIGMAVLKSRGGEGGSADGGVSRGSLATEEERGGCCAGRRSSRWLGGWLLSIAHEINNPLEAITNCLYLVGDE